MPRLCPHRFALALITLVGCGRIHALGTPGDDAGEAAADGGSGVDRAGFDQAQEGGHAGPDVAPAADRPPPEPDAAGEPDAERDSPGATVDARDAAKPPADAFWDADAPVLPDVAPEMVGGPCPQPFVDRWSYALTTGSRPWFHWFGDPSIDVAAGELNLTYDDVVRRAPAAGNYQFSFDLRLERDITFFPTVADVFTYQPAIVRQGDQIILTGQHYSSSGAKPTGGFTGQTLPAGTLRVTFFAKVDRREIALRVRAGGVTYRSGFIFADGDASAILLVGNNYSPGDGPARVGALSGCAGMTEAELQRSYDL